MSYLSDTLTVGLILVLVFGSIALYLYTRVQQTEQKVSLLESIVLDLKLTGEIPSFSDPAPFSSASAFSASQSHSQSQSQSHPPSQSQSQSHSHPPSQSQSHSHSHSHSHSPSASSASVSDSTSVSVPDHEQVFSTIQEYKPFDEEEIVEISEPEIAFHSLDAQEAIDHAEPLGQGDSLEQVEAIPMSSYDHMSVKELQAEARIRGLSVEKGAKKHALIDLLKKADAEAKPVSTSSLASLEPFPHDEE